jgi:hypothetical protein
MWNLKADERIARWRDFRNQLSILSLEDALTKTSEFWSRAPFVPYNLDYTEPSTWPDPWTLVYENTYCDLAKCLGIVYTMLLTEHRNNLDIEIRVFKNPKNNHEYNLAWFNRGKYVLNMIDGSILNIEHLDKTLELKAQYTAEDLQLDNY